MADTPKKLPAHPVMYPPSAQHEQSPLDERLEAFLKSFDEDAKRGHTIANVRVEINQFARRMNQLETKSAYALSMIDDHTEKLSDHDRRLDAHGVALINIKRRIRTSPEDTEMSTGNYDLKTIQREVEEQKAKRLYSERVKADNALWWQRQIVLWVGGSIGAVVLVVLSIIITLAVKR